MTQQLFVSSSHFKFFIQSKQRNYLSTTMKSKNGVVQCPNSRLVPEALSHLISFNSWLEMLFPFRSSNFSYLLFKPRVYLVMPTKAAFLNSDEWEKQGAGQCFNSRLSPNSLGHFVPFDSWLEMSHLFGNAYPL